MKMPHGKCYTAIINFSYGVIAAVSLYLVYRCILLALR